MISKRPLRRDGLARPIRYGLAQRCSDWYHGWRDARANVPAADGDGPVMTPTQRVLVHTAEVAAESERLLFELDRCSTWPSVG